MKKILLTGGSGTLGKEIIKIANDKSVFIKAPSHKDMDVCSFKSVYAKISEDTPDLIIHAAAFIGLEPCEQNKTLAYNTNVIGTGIVCRAADHLGVPLVYISTDYVFDGSQGYYDEQSIPNPLSYYAKTKWAGESIVLSYCKNVLRTSFCKKEWPHPLAFEDKWTSMDSVNVIASLVLDCSIKHASWKSCLHVGTERKTFLNMAQRSRPDVKPASCRDMKVRIPIDTSFDTTKMKEVLNS